MGDAFGKVQNLIEQHSMLSRSSGVVVAVSGGADSVALLDMLMRLAAGEQPVTGRDKTAASIFGPEPRLHVAHVNHNLRGHESDEDAEFVRAVAKRSGLPFTVISVDVRTAASASGRSIEDVAREFRYSALLATARKSGCDRIATGHTMNDQVETFLMRLARGAGLRGLAAMRPVIEAHGFGENGVENMWEGADGGEQIESDPSCAHPSSIKSHPLLIRPLLCILRDEIEEYCRARNLEFRTDTSNENVNYTRNRARLEVVPALRALNPRVVEHIARAAEIIAEDQDTLDNLARAILDEARLTSKQSAPGQEKSGNISGWPNDSRAGIGSHYSSYSIPLLLKQPIGLRRRAIIEAIRRESGRVKAGEEAKFQKAQTGSIHVAAVERLMEELTSGSRVDLPGGLQVWREFDALVFKHSTGRDVMLEMDGYEYEINRDCPSVEAGGFIITLSRGEPGHLLKASLEQARREKDRSGQDWMMAALDDQLLPERLVIRTRRKGERVRVPGRRQTIKLKNLMIGHKIPPSRRALWPIVATLDGRYIWTPGLPPASEFTAHDETHGLVILRASGI